MTACDAGSDNEVTPDTKQPKCNANNECVLCDSNSTSQQYVRARASSSRRQNMTLMLSSNCSYLVKSENTYIDEDIEISARALAAIHGPGRVKSLKAQANIVVINSGKRPYRLAVDNAIRINGATTVKASHVDFDSTYGGVIIQNTANLLDAEIIGVSNKRGPCAGVVNSRGSVAVSDCNCGTTQHGLVIQNPEKDTNLTTSLTSSDGCTIFDSSLEFAMFGREYEIRINNDGEYEYDPLIVEQFLPIMAVALVALVFMLPFCHSAMWNMLLVSLSKKRHTD